MSDHDDRPRTSVPSWIALCTLCVVPLALFLGALPAPGEPVPYWQSPEPIGTPVGSYYEEADAVVRAFEGGTLPTWAPRFGLGQPLAAATDAVPWYPLHFVWRFVEPRAAARGLASLHALLAGLGLCAFLVRRGHAPVAALGGALCLQGSVFALTAAARPDLAEPAAWFGWIFLGVQHALDGGRRASLLTVAAVSLALLAGSFAVGALGVAAGLAFAVVGGLARWFERPRDGEASATPILRATGFVLLGVLAAAVRWVPALEAAALGTRPVFEYPSALPVRLFDGWFEDLSGLVFEGSPALLRSPRHGFAILSAVALALAFAGVLRGRGRGLPLGIFLCGLACQSNSFGLGHVPAALAPLGGAPIDGAFLCAFAFAWLVALGVERAFERDAAAFNVALAIPLAVVVTLLVRSSPAHLLVFSGLAFAALLVVRLCADRELLSAREAPWFLCFALLIAPALREAPATPLAGEPDRALLEEVRGESGLVRRVFQSRPELFGRPPLLARQGLADPFARSGYALARTDELLFADAPLERRLDLAGVEVVLGDCGLDETRLEPRGSLGRHGPWFERRDVPARAEVLPRAIDCASDEIVRGLLLTGHREGKSSPVLRVSSELDPALRASGPSDSHALTRGFEPGTLQTAYPAPHRAEASVRGTSGGWLVFRDAWAPGWKCTVDGEDRDVVRVDHAYRAVELEPGDELVRTWYEPWSLRIGTSLTLLGWILTALSARRLATPR